MESSAEQTLYHELRDYPRPQYPFANLSSPHMERLAAECDKWVEEDCPFASDNARAVFKKHRFTDVAARAFPSFTLEELRPIARFSAFFAMIDDYLDHANEAELDEVRDRATALLFGHDKREPEPGFYRQVYIMRGEALACGVPMSIYEDFSTTIVGFMDGYDSEKRYNATNEPPPLDAYVSIRRQTSGGLPYAKYLAFDSKYRELPADVLQHPTILRMHDLVSTLIGYHNDFISLPKELHRKGDVINLVLVVKAELVLPLREAYLKALEIHDVDLAEFVRLQNTLPCFGKWQSTIESYVEDLGTMVQGVYSWHVMNTGRYLPGAYVEPEQ
jgi:hypothetical protein